MTPEVQLNLLKASVKSLAIEANQRLGDESPWTEIDIDSLDAQALVAAKRSLHEVLYAPPNRGQ